MNKEDKEYKIDDYYDKLNDIADDNDDEEMSECCGSRITDMWLCSDCLEHVN